MATTCLSVLKSFSSQLLSREASYNLSSRKTKSKFKPSHHYSHSKHRSKSKSHSQKKVQRKGRNPKSTEKAPTPSPSRSPSLHSRSYATTPNFLALPRPKPPISSECTCDWDQTHEAARECVCSIEANIAHRVSHLDLNFGGSLDTLKMFSANDTTASTERHEVCEKDCDLDATDLGLSEVWLRHITATGGSDGKEVGNLDGELGGQHANRNEHENNGVNSFAERRSSSSTQCSSESDRKTTEGAESDCKSEASEMSCVTRGSKDSCGSCESNGS